MSFWDSQILGVIVGAAVGGLGKIVYDIRATNQACEKLDKGIRAEIKVIKDAMKTGRDGLEYYHHIITSGGPITQPPNSPPAYRMSYTEANLEKIGMLDSAFLEPLVKMRAMLEVLPEGFQILMDARSEVIAGDKKSLPTMILLLETVIATLKNL